MFFTFKTMLYKYLIKKYAFSVMYPTYASTRCQFIINNDTTSMCNIIINKSCYLKVEWLKMIQIIV